MSKIEIEIPAFWIKACHFCLYCREDGDSHYCDKIEDENDEEFYNSNLAYDIISYDEIPDECPLLKLNYKTRKL